VSGKDVHRERGNGETDRQTEKCDAFIRRRSARYWRSWSCLLALFIQRITGYHARWNSEVKTVKTVGQNRV
jgi:hypothetical protein